MNTLIFRTMAPLIAIVMIIYSLFILLRGHNDPGGGFIGGLIAASAVAIYAMPFGVGRVRQLLLERRIKGARKIGGQWFIPRKFVVTPGERGPKPRK